MKNLFKKFFYWFMVVSRGYSAPMSILNWLVAFVCVYKLCPEYNILYGIGALFGIVFAHLGTNLFDDCVDYVLKVPKQDCKTKYLEEGFISIRGVFLSCCICFLIAALIGAFFFLKLGLPVAVISSLAAIIIILYPKLNNFALGEAAVGLCFGVLMFLGVNYVMASSFNVDVLLISLPTSLLTVAVVFVHSIMDYDFDKINNKRTLCVALGSKKRALCFLMFIYILTFALGFYYIFLNVLPKAALVLFLAVLPVIKLYFSMKKHIENPQKDDFMPNFILARNISLFYNILLIASLCFGR